MENKIVLRKLAAYVYYAFKKRNEIAYIKGTPWDETFSMLSLLKI